VRQLERLFTEQLGSSIGRHYRALRLDHARRLLRHTSMSVIETALACGFSNAAHFSRAYRDRFGGPPRVETGRGLSGHQRDRKR
jgi:transcriptional regulator GlxA family with amidase domain